MSLDHDRREAEADLVEQDEVAGWTSAPGRSPPSAAGRRRARSTARCGAPSRIGKRRVDALERPAARAAELAADQEVLLDRERREEPAALRHQRDAARRRSRSAAGRRSARRGSATIAASHADEAGDRLAAASILPAPLAPISASTSPSLERRRRRRTAPGNRRRRRRARRRRGSAQASRLDPHVDLGDLAARHHRLRLALGDLPAEIDDDQPVDHGEQRVHDVLDPDDR